jgi:hypothetical protein
MAACLLEAILSLTIDVDNASPIHRFKKEINK